MQSGNVQVGHQATALLDIEELSAELGCSKRHIYRLVQLGRMPKPVRLGALVRFRRVEIAAWLAQGCPAIVDFDSPGNARSADAGQ